VRLVVLALLFMMTSWFVFAITPAETAEAENLINSSQNCNSLSGDQLEIIGEYYMEMMHPGDAHDFMHKMMGLEEGTAEERQFHINLAKAAYCGSGSYNGMMGNRVRSNMMRNMMGYGNASGYGYYGMMGNYDISGVFDRNVFEIILLVLLAGLIAFACLSIWNKKTGNRKVKK